tara:strand:+ start:512 stop:640 length:129 start_codon:yes stop_codon:yes gene_type:complete
MQAVAVEQVELLVKAQIQQAVLAVVELGCVQDQVQVLMEQLT